MEESSVRSAHWCLYTMGSSVPERDRPCNSTYLYLPTGQWEGERSSQGPYPFFNSRCPLANLSPAGAEFSFDYGIHTEDRYRVRSPPSSPQGSSRGPRPATSGRSRKVTVDVEKNWGQRNTCFNPDPVRDSPTQVDATEARKRSDIVGGTPSPSHGNVERKPQGVSARREFKIRNWFPSLLNFYGDPLSDYGFKISASAAPNTTHYRIEHLEGQLRTNFVQAQLHVRITAALNH
ncbi:hypothetical protein C8F04DRAFT_1321685 [Mycena alexandri]|uniref:Uncharacterized protein n=1 Tax=Mycena alexandri TaxID=1745969 RepID=A0AAD6T484_9AGAR|nr:hypothetical protein C8F04DRAFT_1321685 [Mycena alexandri]